MRKLSRIFTIIALTSSAVCALHAAEWQWSVSLPGTWSADTESEKEAFLWIPPTCLHVNAVLIAQQNMTEEVMLRSEMFRNEMERLGVALLFIAPDLDLQWDVNNGCQQHFERMLDTLSVVSGYGELSRAPISPFGLSAQATFPWNFAAWNPERTLCILSYHGDAPRTNLCGYGRENLEWGRTRNIDGIPGLMIEGEYEWWEARVNPALSFRMMYPESCISFLCDAGRGHFDLCDATLHYMALFIEKAIQMRLMPEGLAKVSVSEGWLADRWRDNQRHRPTAAPYDRYKGDPHDAFWYPDKEMALLTEQRYSETRRKKSQYLSFEQKGVRVKYDPDSHVKMNIPFRPEDDGVTFHLKAVFTDESRNASSTCHVSTAPRIRVVSGPCIQINDTTFRLAFYCTGLSNKRRWGGITFCAECDGDKHYKSAVQEINIQVPLNDTGERQTIAFNTPKPIGEGRWRLDAQSSAGLPVSYYVKHGPAHIEGDMLVLHDAPPRTSFPLEVSVVAWQHGIQGQVCSAKPVEQRILIQQ